MKLLLLIAAIGLLAGQASQAQPRVYHVSGEAYYVAKKGPQRLRFQDAVQPGQVLELKPGSQVVFINAQGQTVTYAKAGTVAYAVLQQAFAATPPSPGRAYLAYIWQKMYISGSPLGNAPVGGVSRGDQPLLWAPADSVVLDQPEATFQWISDEAPCLFTLTDAAGNAVLRLKTPASTLSLNFLLSRLKQNTVYYWSVAPATDPAANAPRRAIVWADEALQSQLTQELPAPGPQPLSAAEQRWQAQFRARWVYGRVGPGGQ